MDETKDLLQIKIDNARALLSKESREAIDAVNWRGIIAGMNTKYNTEQLENLETETELMLCGLLLPQDFHKELQDRMRITSSEVDFLVKEMDKLIFNKMQMELEKRIKEDEVPKPTIFAQKTNTPGPSFVKTPKEVTPSTTKTDYQKELYEIANEQKLSIDQMGKLEIITNKIMLGTIHPENYTKILETDLGLAPDKATELASKVNQKILKNIRESMKSQTQAPLARTVLANKDEEIAVPLPPTKTIKTEVSISKPIAESIATQTTFMPTPIIDTKVVPQMNLSRETESQNKIFSNSGIEMEKDAPVSAPANLPTIQNVVGKEEAMMKKDGINILEPEIATPKPPMFVNKKVEDDMLKNIENPEKTPMPPINVNLPKQTVDLKPPPQTNIMKDKLSKPVVNVQVATDQSLPKMGGKDPYREPIE